MKIYDYNTGDIVDITPAQYDFVQVIIKYSGRMDNVLKEYPVSEEDLKAWEADPVFWPVLQGHISILIKSRGLTADYVKDFLINVMAGKSEPSDTQMKAVQSAIRALGMGVTQRTGLNGAITISPENTKIIFNDEPTE